MNSNYKEKYKIAVDYDGCLAKTMDFVCDLINFKTGGTHNYKDIKTWTHWEDIGLGKEFWDCYDFLDKKGRLLIKPYDGYVFSALNKIESDNGKLNVVTANNEVAINDITSWINYYGEYDGDMKWLNFEVNCIGRKTAAEKLELDYDIYIDDNPHLAEAAQDFLNKRILLANAPWNKHIPNSENVRRFESWDEIPKLIESIKVGDYECDN